ncbi:unnamed protein product, partial [Rotaria magnacalcarata]
AVLELRKQP